MEGLVPAQETNMDLPRAKKETVLGIQSPIKRGIVNLPMEGQDPARDKDRGATMSSQVRAPDTLELDMDKPQLNLEMADIGIRFRCSYSCGRFSSSPHSSSSLFRQAHKPG